MTVKPIYLHPHPVLREKCAEITTFDAELHSLMDDLCDTVKAAKNGAGLAAPQIGVAKRALVIDERLKDPEMYDKTKSTLVELINPKLTKQSDEKVKWELGCLSIPAFYAEVQVPYAIEITAQDRHGKTFTLDAEDYYAAGILHEMDHLDGILFPDHLGGLKRKLLWERYKKRLPQIIQNLDYEVVTGY